MAKYPRSDLNRAAALAKWRLLLSAWVQAVLAIRREFSFV